MRKTAILILFLLIVAIGFSQNLRYVKGMNQVRAGFESSFRGAGATLGYKRMITDKIMIGFHSGYENSIIKNTAYKETRFSVESGYRVFDAFESLFIMPFAGINTNIVNKVSEVESKSDTKPVFGNNIGLEVDYYFWENLSVYGRLEQRIGYINGNHHIFISEIGISLSFY